MGIVSHVKKNIISFLREGKIIIICFLLFPMLMAYIYGIIEDDMFQGKNNFNSIKVQFIYDKASKEGEILTDILKDDKVKNFISVAEETDSKCKVTISKDFKSMDIQKLKSSSYEIDMVHGFMATFSENINQYKVVMDNVNKLKLTEVQKVGLTNKLINKLSESNKKSLIQEQLVEGYRSLGAREYFTISMFSFTSIMLIMVFVKVFYKDKRLGVIRRSFSTPYSKVSYFIGFLTSSFIVAVTINFIYVAINWSLKIAFLDNFVGIIVLVFLQSFLQIAVIGAFISFIKSEAIVNSIMKVLIFVPLIIGGVFYNVDIIEIKILKVISEFSPNSLILNSYKNLAITQMISGAKNEIIIMIFLSIVLLGAGLLKVKVRWEE